MAKEDEKLCFACPGRYPAAYSSCPRCQLALVFEKIGKVWRVEGLVGRGGMGAVFAAHHESDRRKRAAVKVLVPVAGEQKADRAERIARFQREAAAMERLTHQNIVELYDFARERDGSLYLAMEFLEGPTLAKVLKERGPLPPREAAELIIPVLSALEASHKVGVIHRDLKPDNIVLATIQDGKKTVERVKVVDFGVARLKDDSLTDAGQALGTPVYMAPEQAQGGDIDERVDVYGAGAVLYELLSGRPPFLPPDAPNANLAVLAQIMTTDAEMLSARCPDVPKGVESVVMRALCRDREQRFASAGEFITALQRALEHPDEVQWTRPEGPFEIALPPAVAAAAQQVAGRSSSSLPQAGRSAQGLPPVLRHSIPPVLRQSLSPLSRRSLPPAAPLSPLSPLHSGPSRLSGQNAGQGHPGHPGLSSHSAGGLSQVTSSNSDAGRSHGGITPVPPSHASLVSPAPSLSSLGIQTKQGTSLLYKLLIASIYLIVVSVILVSLLLDRNSCRGRAGTGTTSVPVR